MALVVYLAMLGVVATSTQVKGIITGFFTGFGTLISKAK